MKRSICFGQLWATESRFSTSCSNTFVPQVFPRNKAWNQKEHFGTPPQNPGVTWGVRNNPPPNKNILISVWLPPGELDSSANSSWHENPKEHVRPHPPLRRRSAPGVRDVENSKLSDPVPKDLEIQSDHLSEI